MTTWASREPVNSDMALIGQFENSAGIIKIAKEMENLRGIENGFLSRSARAEVGFPWDEIKELRREKMKEFQGAVSSVFEELISKISNGEDHR